MTGVRRVARRVQSFEEAGARPIGVARPEAEQHEHAHAQQSGEGYLPCRRFGRGFLTARGRFGLHVHGLRPSSIVADSVKDDVHQSTGAMSDKS